MAFVKHEFYCSGSCGKYFDFVLNMNLNGNYRIHCPNCGHIHFRVVKDGKVTDGRFTDQPESPIIEDIYPMKSSCRDTQKETVLDADQNLKGFMHRLWSDVFSTRAS
jgi:predicted  nucleic acid-binding Zn-ribbon protein